MRLDLQPVPRALARQVAGVETLGHDSLEPLLLRGLVERLAVVERLREAHDLVSTVEELFEPLSPLGERQVDHRLALDLQHVEDVVDDGRPRLPLLHRREARATGVVERADLAVEDAIRSLDGFRGLLRHILEPCRQVVPVAARERDIGPGDGRDRAVAVPLHLERPPRAPRNLFGEGCKHRHVAAAAAAGNGGGLVALADDQPVLLVAAEMSRHERPGSLELRPVQTHGQTAVLLLLEQLVGAAVPDLHGAGPVLALRDLPCEGRVLERMVFHMDGEVLLPRLERDALRHGPTGQSSVLLEAEVIVEAACVVPLHDEDRLLRLLFLPTEGLRGLFGVALALVLGELFGHDLRSFALRGCPALLLRPLDRFPEGLH